jgi:hypothetical protein
MPLLPPETSQMLKRTFLFAACALVARPSSALYDAKPLPLLEPALGTWSGSLTYRDYQKPDKMVTLAATMVVTLSSPDELALYYVFDDGPGKTVYSYERMQLDIAAKQVLWIVGTTKPSRTEYNLISSGLAEGKTALSFEKSSDKGTDKYVLEFTDSRWSLTKYEQPAGGAELLRSSYEFKKRA